MMNVRFDGYIRRENVYPAMEVSDKLSFDISSAGDDRARCHAYINVMALMHDGYYKIGELEFYSYNSSMCNLEIEEEEFEDFDFERILFNLMDMESGDTANYYEILQSLYSSIKVEDAEDIIFGDDVHVIALQRFFINPEYRGMGIGKFIANNLSKVIFEATNIKPLYCVGAIVPDDGTSETREIQAKTMVDAGFIVAEDDDGEYIFGGCIYDEDIV